MAMALVAVQIENNEEEAAAVAELRINRRRLRDQEDPFELPETYFKKLFRISKYMVMDIVENLRPVLQRQRWSGLSVECQVLCAIRFFAVGSYQRAVGQDCMVAISQTSVSRCIREVSFAINQQMFRQWVKFPATERERQEATAKFRRAPQPFTGAIGAIDCTHVRIVAPKEHEEVFMSHHGYHSINVQMVCDPNLKILNVNAKFPGSRHDAAIWVQSPVRRLMRMCYENGERGTWLLGDSGYPLEPWVMTAIVNAAEGTREYAYTRAHCQARCVIERYFGTLKMVWRCLLQQRILMYEPEVAGLIINACCTLHNMRIHYGENNCDEVLEDAAEPIIELDEAEPLRARERLAEARRMREDIINRHY